MRHPHPLKEMRKMFGMFGAPFGGLGGPAPQPPEEEVERRRGEYERGENPNVQPAEENLPPNFSRQDNPAQSRDY